MKKIHLGILALCLTLGCIGCDQATKIMAREYLHSSAPLVLFGDAVRLQYVENRGGFLSLGASLSSPLRFWLLVVGVGITLLLVGGIVVFEVVRRSSTRLNLVIGLSLVLGGGVSNLSDRILNSGEVIDFLNVGIGSLRTGVFNLADTAIMIGVVCLLFSKRDAASADPPQS